MKKQKILAVMLMAAMTTSLLAGCGAKKAEAPVNAPQEENKEEAMASLIEGTEQKEVDADRKTTDTSDDVLDKFTIAVNADVTNWDPNAQIDTSGYLMRDLVYQNLFISVNDEYTPLVAKGYTVIDDHHYQVEIWDNIYDSEGNHLTADDVVFCYNNKVESGSAAKFDAFESIKKIDDYTVEFTWTDAISSVGALDLIWGETYLYTQNAYENHNFATNPIGTGPYAVSELVTGAKIVLDKRDDYWKTEDLTWYEVANVQTLEYDIITESSQNYVGLQTGSIDFSANIPDENIVDFSDGGALSDKYDLYEKMRTMTYVLGCNQSASSIGADENFRLAVYYALDNNSVAKAAGNFTGATCFANPAGVDFVPAWAEKDTYVKTFDPELAKEYLAKSGYKGEKLVLLGESNEAVKSALTMIQALLTNVGINTEISVGDYPTVVTTFCTEDAWDVCLFYYGGGVNISGMNRILNDDEWGNGCSWCFVNDDKLDELFDTAKTREGHTDENMEALIDYIVDKAYYDMVFIPTLNIVYNNELASMYVDGTGTIAINASTFYLD